MLRKLHWILLLLFLVLLVVLGAVVYRSRSANWPTYTGITSYPLLTSPERESTYLPCVLLLDKLDRNTDKLGDILILRKAPCIYRLPNGDQETISVPLAFFNPALDAFYWVGGTITSGLGIPGDPYIDGKINENFGVFGTQPNGGVWSESAKSTENNEIVTFFAKTRETLPQNWAKQFAISGDKAVLPITESGDEIFLADSLIFNTKP